ncbi:MAG: hypothetical protein CMI26_10840 [Opitutae bacterium]|nr:hypothetical protein [Opitutae bacterium]
MNFRKNWSFAVSLAFTFFGFGLFYSVSLAKKIDAVSVEEKRSFINEVRPIFVNYCYDCHGDGASKGDFVLDDALMDEGSLEDESFWKKIWQNLYKHSMPPPRKPKPSVVERKAVLGAIERTVFGLDPNKPDPGRVTIRRLNRVEYDNVIRDLTGIDFQPAQDFPPDDTGHGFDTVGDALSLSPLLLEKYMSAADNVLDKALGEFPPPRKLQRIEPKDMIGAGYARDARVLSTTGEVEVPISLPRPGEYRFRARAWASRAGGEFAKMKFRLNDRDLKTFEVTHDSPDTGTYEVSTKVERAGKVHFRVSFLNDFYDPRNSNPKRRDRNLFLQWLEVEAPSGEPSATLEASRLKILGTRPEGSGNRAFGEFVLRRFVPRAYRRPVTEKEIFHLLRLYDVVGGQGAPFMEAIRLPLKAALVSPRFLYRAESQPSPDDPKAVHDLDEFALASRLSFFLWSSMPDDRLLTLASKKQLRSSLSTEVRRMLSDNRSLAFAKNFAGQWLQLRDLEIVQPDKKSFPGFDDKLRQSMRGETEAFFRYLLMKNRPVTEFLDADYTFVNASLARHYGLPGKFGEDLKYVSLKGTSLPRGGVLTHASLLTITSNPTRTSPVKRGKWVLDSILGTPVKDPPPDIPEIDFSASGSKGKTLREQLALHTENPLCASCHVSMDAIGFSLENYDAIGRWRLQDAGNPIDSAGKLSTGETFTGALELQRLIVHGRKEAFVRCLTEKLLTYALGRGIEYYDRPQLDKIAQRMSEGGYLFSDLIIYIVESVPFQKRRGDFPAE